MRYFLVINPRSRNERSRKTFPAVLETFRRRGAAFDHVFASSYQSVQAESAYANRQGYDVIVAMGGDGTINGVLNGFYDAAGRRISSSRMAVIYTGTSPDFCKSYGIPTDTAGSLANLFSGQTRRIRTGRIVFTGEGVKEEGRSHIFACCANIGLGAEVATLSNRIRKYTGDFAGTLIAVAWNLLAAGPREIILRVDERQLALTKVMNIAAGRTKYIASGIRVPAGLADGDDRLYLLTAGDIGWRSLPGLLYSAYAGKVSDEGVLQLRYARAVDLRSPGRETGVECDGDATGFLPCSIGLAPDPLDLVADSMQDP